MLRHVLFIQGGGERAHDEWDNKLVESLEQKLGPDYQIHYPRMPDEANPQYIPWKKALKKEFATLGDGAILVGHSIGATILIAVLADELPDWTPSGVFLIAAPFVGPGGWPSEDVEPMSDLAGRLPAGLPVNFYHGSEDKTVPFQHVSLYERAIPHAVVCRLSDRDHQLDNDLSEVAGDIRRLPIP
jgi:predicted alpha/beta hydrolase family esterase